MSMPSLFAEHWLGSTIAIATIFGMKWEHAWYVTGLEAGQLDKEPERCTLTLASAYLM